MRKSEILQEDFFGITESFNCIDNLADSKFLVTGATGLIGSLVVKFLIYLSDKYEINIKITAIVRSISKVENVYGRLMSDSRINFIYTDLTKEEVEISDDINYIIHAASVTASQQMISNPVGVIDTAVIGTDKILKLALNHKIKAMVYLSSMEVYGVVNKSDKINENELGFVDPQNIRSCYPQSKRMCETLCLAYCSQYGVPVMIARLAQTFGGGAL